MDPGIHGPKPCTLRGPNPKSRGSGEVVPKHIGSPRNVACSGFGLQVSRRIGWDTHLGPCRYIVYAEGPKGYLDNYFATGTLLDEVRG